MLVLGGLVGLQRTWTTSASFAVVFGAYTSITVIVNDIGMEQRSIGSNELERNRDHSAIYENSPKCRSLDSFVDYKACPISSKGFLPTVVNVMVT